MSAAPVPTQPKKSGNLFLKIVVAILAFIALVSVLVIGSCFYIGYRIKKKADEVQQAYKKGDVGKIIGALGQDQTGSAPDLGKILGALGKGAAQGGSGTEETVQEQPCHAVDPSQSKTFRAAAASASIPLVPGLTLSLAWTNRDLGGRDVEILNTVQGIDNNTVTIEGVRAEESSVSSQRVLCIADLLNARQYETGWGTNIPETIPGATMFSMPRTVFQDLKAARPAGFEFFSAYKRGNGRYAIVGDQKGQLSRVEPGDVPYSIIVNGERKDLPAIHVKGKLGTHDTEAFVLDEPANPITLSWNMPAGWNFHINYLKITFPVEKEIQKEIAKTGCAAVYGIYFDFNSAIVRPESGPSLKEIAEAIKNNPAWKLRIEGHTDNVGGDAYNLNLSNRRAAAAKQALETQYHIDPGRVTSQGFGASRPKAPNTTPEGRALNRRVEVCRE
ncbi:MAG: OmpA family protein [Terriglobia bacterium]